MAPPSDTFWPPIVNRPVAVLGYGVEGRSTLRHLLRHGARDVVVLDKAAPADALPDGVKGLFGTDYLKGLEDVAVAFRAPGVRPLVPEVAGFIARGGLLTSQVEAALVLAGRERVIGVTGTLGKGTCCSILSAMLEAAKIPHVLAGNIGLPPLDALDDLPPDTLLPEALLLLELSSFQLSTLRESPRGAVVVRTTIEHLDWHADQGEYWDHKANLVRFQKTGDFCVFYADAEGSAWIGTLGEGKKIAVGSSGVVRISGGALEAPGHGLRLRLADTRLTGAFNLENLAAAAAAALELGVSPGDIAAAARAFAPLEHRLEFVREAVSDRGRVRYYNDSYATRPEAALAAARALDQAPGNDAVGLILGGSEKFADFGELATGLAALPRLRAIALIGHTAERLEASLREAGALESGAGRAWRRCATLDEAVEYLRREIPAGSILLSPACASFGLFKDYKERGKAFKKIVSGL
jgi:UDP-N-acetylmuramoylalanine--D-glutamate ligase